MISSPSPFAQSPILNSSVIEVTPTALRLIPEGLLTSPWASESPPKEFSPKLKVNEKSANPTTGLQVTTNAGVTVAIHDPHVAEQLILNPLRSSLLSIARACYTDSEAKENLSELIRLRNMMSRAFEEYINVFGCSPCPEGQNKQFYLDYLYEATKDSDERRQLKSTLKLAQEQFSEQTKYPVPVDHLFKTDEDTSVQHSGGTIIAEKFGTVPVKGFSTVWQKLKSTPIKWEENALVIHEADLPVHNNQDWLYQTKLTDTNKSSRLTEANDFVYNIRYKTQPCRHFEKFRGYCPIGDSCYFAHGPEELRNPQDHPKFRTKPCRHFSEKGVCAFGDRCFFLHTSPHSGCSGIW